jgi:hypothetical protein
MESDPAICVKVRVVNCRLGKVDEDLRNLNAERPLSAISKRAEHKAPRNGAFFKHHRQTMSCENHQSTGAHASSAGFRNINNNAQ